MNRRPLKKTSRIEYMVERANQNRSRRILPERKKTDREESEGEGRDRTPQYEDTREEMERGCEGKTEVEAIGQ